MGPDEFVAGELPVVAAVFHGHLLPKMVFAHLQVSCTPGWSGVAAGLEEYRFWASFERALLRFLVGVFAAALCTLGSVLPGNVRGWVQYSLKVCVQAGNVPVADFAADGFVRSVAAALPAAGGPAQSFVAALPVAVLLQVLFQPVFAGW